MNYDQSWMGYGWIGGMEAGAISLAAGFVLFVITILVNTIAAIIVNRGRSSAMTEI